MGFTLKFVFLTEQHYLQWVDLIYKPTLLNWHRLHFNHISHGTNNVWYKKWSHIWHCNLNKCVTIFLKQTLATLPLLLSVKCSNVISKRNLLYLLHLPSGPNTLLMCILSTFRQLKIETTFLRLDIFVLTSIVALLNGQLSKHLPPLPENKEDSFCSFLSLIFYFNSLSLLLLFMDKMLKVAKLFIAMSAFLLGMAHGQDGKEPRFFSQWSQYSFKVAFDFI